MEDRNKIAANLPSPEQTAQDFNTLTLKNIMVTVVNNTVLYI